MKNILDNFRLKSERESFQTVIERISDGVEFKGTNLWVLVFAIFIASLGLNVNSTAVIIGAMLVSPLMGPIMGVGLGIAINDLSILKKALFNYFFAAGVGLATSTVYFLLSPINEAHSEILARTSPNIYDVLIALFGGFAGILATSSKMKGNVIPGVAIATALMPPLCTAGYGLATLKFTFFFGAFYLFIINSVFISFATLITVRLLKFPFRHLPEKDDEKRAKRIIWLVVIITLVPSLYFGYDIVQKTKFEEKAKKFIDSEAAIPNDYLLHTEIDPKKKTIILTYGGQYIEESQIETLRGRLPNYELENTTLEVRQGFAYLKEEKTNNMDMLSGQLSGALAEKEGQIQLFKNKLDSLAAQKQLSRQVYKELKAQYPAIESCIVQTAVSNTDTTQISAWLAIINSRAVIKKQDRDKIDRWLKVRLNISQLIIYFVREPK